MTLTSTLMSTDHPPSHRPPRLDSSPSHRMGPDRSAPDVRQERRRLVRGSAVPGAGRERLHPGQPLHPVAVVHAGRAREAHRGILLRAVGLGGVRVAYLRRGVAHRRR